MLNIGEIFRLANVDGLDPSLHTRIQQAVTEMEESLVGVGFCLSEEGDLLSQWRGYAADASGVVIGFSRNYLDWLCSSNLPDELGGLNLHKVDYAASAHDSRVAPTSDFLIRMRKQAK